MRYAISELDIFFISYDEPNADALWDDLGARSPRPVQRIHGIKGFDAAHRAAAEKSSTPRFVTIDGDNVVNNSLFFQWVDEGQDGRDLVFSFKAKNVVNGLEYGNGGVKVWPKSLVLKVPTHESGKDGASATDFCWTYRYMQVDHCASIAHPNGSPLQAFRAGYREAVKMSLIGGLKLDSWEETKERMASVNASRLNVWTSVGADIPNGWWTIYGARQGLYDLWMRGLDPDLIRDYDWFDRYWVNFYDHEPDLAAKAIARRLDAALGTITADLDAKQSRWFKTTYLNPERTGLMIPDLAPILLDEDD